MPPPNSHLIVYGIHLPKVCIVVHHYGARYEVDDHYISTAFSNEQTHQANPKEPITPPLSDTSIHIQRLPATSPIMPRFTVEFHSSGLSYIYLEHNGVFQWFFDGPLPAGITAHSHAFFSEELIPVTYKTIRDLDVLYSAVKPTRICMSRSPNHLHYNLHIYLTIDMRMSGPCGGDTTFMRLKVCEDIRMADLFGGAGGDAARKDVHMLRNIAWSSHAPGQTLGVMSMGGGCCYGIVRRSGVTMNNTCWKKNNGVVWLYPCQLMEMPDFLD